MDVRNTSSQEVLPERELDTMSSEKDDLTNALKYCESVLRNMNLISNSPPSVISSNSIAMGEIIADEILAMLGDRIIIDDDELIGMDEIDESGDYVSCESSVKNYGEEFPETPSTYIPLWYKEKAVAFAAAHAKWSLSSIQSKGFALLKHKRSLYRWKEDVKKGGNRMDKWKMIDHETFERFMEARSNLEQVTTRTTMGHECCVAIFVR